MVLVDELCEALPVREGTGDGYPPPVILPTNKSAAIREEPQIFPPWAQNNRLKLYHSEFGLVYARPVDERSERTPAEKYRGDFAEK